MRYFLVTADEWSGHVNAEPMKGKDETLEAFKVILARMKEEAKSSPSPTSRTLRTDQGTEFMSSAFQAFLRDEGMKHQTSVPYEPQQNGRAERFVRSVKEKVTTLLVEGGFPTRYWAEVLPHATFTINALPFSPNGGNTPHFSLHGSEPDFFKKGPIVGQKIFVHDPTASTFEAKASTCRFIAFGRNRGRKGFRVQPVKASSGVGLFWSRDIYFDQKDVPSRPPWADDDDEELFGHDSEEEPEWEEGEMEGEKMREFSEKELGSKWGAEEGVKRSRKPTAKARGVAGVVLATTEVEFDSEEDVVLLVRSGQKLDLKGRPPPDVPATTKEALSSLYGGEWREGDEEELAGFDLQDAWELEEAPPGACIIGSRMHRSVRKDGEGNVVQLKSRVVIQGLKSFKFLSQYGSTFTPLPTWPIVAIFLTLVSKKKLKAKMTDLKKGYLAASAAEGREPIYVRQPAGYEVPGKEKYVYRIKRAAYGLPQSGRALHLKMRNFMDRIDFVAVSDEATLYIGMKDGELIYFLLYVDDGIIAGTERGIGLLVSLLADEFDLVVRGPLDGGAFLGRNISHNEETGEIKVGVKAQIMKVLKNHDFECLKPLHLPIQPSVKVVKWEGEPVDKDGYLSIVGSLLFIAVTRPDVQYAVGVAARYSSNPGPAQWTLLKRILAYLSATKEVALRFGGDGETDDGLQCLVDADFASDVDTRKSTTGAVFTLFGSTIESFSRRQGMVTTSTYKAELCAMAVAVQELEWLSSLLTPLQIITHSPLPVFSDNRSAVLKLNSPSFSKESKSLDVKVKYVREQAEKGFLSIQWIPGADNLADLLTKPLSASRAKELGMKLGLVGWPEDGKWGSK